MLRQLQIFSGTQGSIKIPRRRVGAVVGKEYRNINSIQDTCNVALQLNQIDHADDGELLLFGPSKNVAKAKKKIQKLIGIRQEITIPKNVALNYKVGTSELYDLQERVSLDHHVDVTSVTDTHMHLRGQSEKHLQQAIHWLKKNIITSKVIVELTPSNVGRVIGKDAHNLRRIVKKFNVVIKKPSGPDSALSMQIEGNQINVENALEEINQIIGIEDKIQIPKEFLSHFIANKFETIMDINKRHNVLMTRNRDEDDDLLGSFNIWSVTASNIADTKKEIDDTVKKIKNMFTTPIDVHESLWGLLIGAKGKNLRGLEALYNVKVHSPRSNAANDPALNANSFVIRGENQKNVDLAAISVKNLTRAPWAYRELNEEKLCMELDVPASHHGRIVGSGGESITQVRERYGIDLRLPPLDIDSTLCVMKGPSMEINLQALEMIGDLSQLSFEHSSTNPITGTPSYIGIPTQRSFGGMAGKRSGPNIDAEILEKINGRRIPINGNESLTGISKVTGAHLPMLLKTCRALDISMTNPLIPLETDLIEMIVLELGGDPVLNDSTPKIVVRSQRLLEDEQGQLRPPIVAVMGHVDHGKTTLLDNLRSGNVAEGEVGGITQATTAFSVANYKNITSNNNNANATGNATSTKGKKKKKKKTKDTMADPANTVTFVDTPGHAAFSSMRESGINSTDILVLVVAADDGVMDQTVESGTSAVELGIPVVVAITKCDLDGIDADNAQMNIESELINHGLVSENLGGEIPVVRVSGLTGEGKEDLIETLSLQSEIMGLKAEYKAPAEAVVLEGAYLKGVGPIADVVVQWGTLNARDFIVVGGTYGRVKSLITPDGKRIKTATPSTPVRIMGLSSVPKAGADLIVVQSLEEARQAAEAFTLRDEWAHMVTQSNESIEEAAATQLKRLQGGPPGTGAGDKGIDEEEEEEYVCNLIVVTNSDGGLSAVETCIDNVTNELGVKFPVLRSIVGEISMGDIEEAAASGAILLTFNTKLPRPIQTAAQNAGLEISNFDLIYQLEDKLRMAANELLPVVFEEKRGGKAEALQIFPLNGKNAGSVIGLRLKQGTFDRKSSYRLIRNGEIVCEDLKVRSLRVLKDDVQEVKSGSDCGLLLEDSNGHGVVGVVGDEVECYTHVEVNKEA